MIGYYWWKHKFYRLCVRNPASGLLQIGCKLKKWQLRHNFPTWRHRQFFNVVLFFLSSLVTGPCFMKLGVMTISFYKGLPRNLGIGNTPSEFFSISGDWDELGITNLARTSNKMLLNAAKCQGYSFYRFWVIKRKPTGGNITAHPPTHPD